MNTEDDTKTPQNRAPHTARVTPDTRSGEVTPPGIRDAIDTIVDYQFTPFADHTHEYEDTSTAVIMFNSKATMDLPKLNTEVWPYNTNDKPTPISIHRARKYLAAAYAAVPSELTGTGLHGYAWMVETPTEWKTRDGVEPTIDEPQKPQKELDYDVKKQLAYADKMEAYRLYAHLVNEGRSKLIKWFGKSMFVDLYKNEMLPVTTTPRDMLDHLTKTYAQTRDNRRHMKTVNARMDAPYDDTKPVEVYFMQLQEARADAALLDEPYTETQLINKALGEFERHLGKDAYKAEKRWNEKTDKTWSKFKSFWKDELHQWETVSKAKRQANHVVTEQFDELTRRFDSMQMNMSALQAENQSYQEHNNALLSKQVHIQQALQTEQQRRGGTDDMSAITDYVDRRIANGLSGQGTNATYTPSYGTNYSGGTLPTADSSGRPSVHQLLQTAKQRAPDSYKNINGGQGKRFGRYCWKCGCNCTHSTRGCYECTDAEKQAYSQASFKDTMGGNTKFLERKDQYQKVFNFDSL